MNGNMRRKKIVRDTKETQIILALEVDGATDEILAFNCTHTLELTESYLRRLFGGENIFELDDWLENTLKQYYGGSSRRAVLTSYRDAVKRYRAMRNGD